MPGQQVPQHWGSHTKLLVSTMHVEHGSTDNFLKTNLHVLLEFVVFLHKCVYNVLDLVGKLLVCDRHVLRKLRNCNKQRSD